MDMYPWMLLCNHSDIQMSHAGNIIIFELVSKEGHIAQMHNQKIASIFSKCILD